MKAFPMAIEESPNRGVGAQGPQELHKGTPNGDHGLLDALGLDDFSKQRPDVIPRFVDLNGSIEVFDGNGDVIEIEQLHRDRGYCRLRSVSSHHR